ncbi:MAG: OmpA family protein [Cyclobacteriaceae bacterium]|nr:OmpA family protein [Cyclobacteriaceae bacterium HetDA_MAG_MS6]
MNLRILLILAALGAAFHYGYPQSVKKLLIKADYTLYKEQFPQAIKQYDQILKKDPKNKDAKYHKLIAEHLTNKRGQDLTDLLAFESSKGHSDKFYNYWMGRVHFMRYELDLAREHLQAFLDLKAYKSREIVAETSHLLDEIENASKFYLNPNEYEVEPLQAPINSTFADISPAFFGGSNELLFASSRPVGNGSSLGNYLIFHTVKNNNDQWQDPLALKELGTFTKNTAKIEVVNENGKLFIFRENGGGDLYFSEPTSTGWTRPVEFDTKVKASQLESHFFINNQEDHILFASKRSGTGLDIYESRLDLSTGSWSSPRAVNGINTQFDEDSPYLSKDGKTMYFSSDRRESMGGFDVFKSEYNASTNSWTTPENLGFPINTIDDEINFQLNNDDISGYLSSNRLHSQGDYDIFYFHKVGKIIAAGQVYDKETGQSIEGITLKFHPIKYADETFRARSDAGGQYKTEIIAEEEFVVEIAYGDEIVLVQQVITPGGSREKVFNKNFYVTLPKGGPTHHTNFNTLYEGAAEEDDDLTLLGSKFRVGRKAVTRNIYFDLHSFHIQPQSKEALDELYRLMKENPNLNIEIGGHTCNIGSHETNMEVSLKRAQSVKEFLVRNTIKPDRIKTVGYGETEPLASNDDEDEGRELNRRIEVKVIE